jgi:uncharacterized membrane protein YeaQ/YmgE (transglycosylase-associated protein family)
MLGALLVGFITGVIARMLIPFDTLRGLRGPKSWLFSLGLGVVGAVLGWLIFAKWIGWGDSNILDLGGIFGSIIGAVIVLIIFNWLVRFHIIGRPGR